MVVKKRFTMPLLFLLVLILFQKQDRFILTVCFFIVGHAISFVYRFITTEKHITNKPLEKLVTSLILVLLIFPVYSQSLNQLSRQVPLVNQEMLEMTFFMRNNTPPNSRYLDLFSGDTQENEWLPYLTRRAPVLAGWGSEWTGTYVIQNLDSSKLGECINSQSYACLEDWFESTGREPDYIIMITKLEKLSVLISQSTVWKNVYTNSKYIIWEHR